MYWRCPSTVLACVCVSAVYAEVLDCDSMQYIHWQYSCTACLYWRTHTHTAPFRDWYPGRQYVDMLMCNGELQLHAPPSLYTCFCDSSALSHCIHTAKIWHIIIQASQPATVVVIHCNHRLHSASMHWVFAANCFVCYRAAHMRTGYNRAGLETPISKTFDQVCFNNTACKMQHPMQCLIVLSSLCCMMP